MNQLRVAFEQGILVCISGRFIWTPQEEFQIFATIQTVLGHPPNSPELTPLFGYIKAKTNPKDINKDNFQPLSKHQLNDLKKKKEPKNVNPKLWVPTVIYIPNTTNKAA